ncbi:MAG: peptidase C11, partial [Clostridia bacterium]|nr:peptidase C11 [Clostridia bacterium]
TWLAINGQVVAYYHTDTEDDGTNYTITGRVPCMINGVRAELILVFDNQNPKGYIAGARYIYTNGETETVAKGIEALDPADVIDFVCDYYSYSGSYQNSYYLGDQITVGDGLTISDVELTDASVVMTYMFTDIYNQEYWSSPING